MTERVFTNNEFSIDVTEVPGEATQIQIRAKKPSDRGFQTFSIDEIRLGTTEIKPNIIINVNKWANPAIDAMNPGHRESKSIN